MTDKPSIEFPCDYPIKIIGLGEDDFAGRMLALVQRHADARLFSLPHLGETSSIELGFRGRYGAVQRAFDDLVAELNNRSLSFELASAA